jgi:[pyruvate, water dikinase]-phosphate phosphotransferase / [pyruvate, water dikinase] kinase
MNPSDHNSSNNNSSHHSSSDYNSSSQGSSNKNHFLHIISDGTGETAVTMLRAALVQHDYSQLQILRHNNVRTPEKGALILEQAQKQKALIVYTIVQPQLRHFFYDQCNQKGLPFLDLLGPILDRLDQFFGISHKEHQFQAGKLRTVDEKYFKRIEAIEYTVRHDDGKSFLALNEADIILLGISRTSKTPLSIFLSHKGFKVANIPIVLNQALPSELFLVNQKKVVALTIGLDSLKRIRSNRAIKLGASSHGDYAGLSHILKEIEYAEGLFAMNRRWPVINVTDRALEETASEIVRIVGSRLGWSQLTEF